MPDHTRQENEVTIDGNKLGQNEIFDLVITSELDHPDTCAVTLNTVGAPGASFCFCTAAAGFIMCQR